MGISIGPALMIAGLAAFGGGGDDGFNNVKPQVFDAEKKQVPDLWWLDFKFRQPRFITANVPGEGRQVVWYMMYEITNRSGEARQFIPKFSLVTNAADNENKVVLAEGVVGKSLESKSFSDVILPNAERAVGSLEQPAGTLFNSVTISAKAIEPTPKDGAPIIRTGVAFWKGVPMGDTKKFDIYVTGLSNGYVAKPDPKDPKKEVVTRKTLVLHFNKPGDDEYPKNAEIKFLGTDWIYK